ncbi:MAG TPA: hypothetical protein VIX12_05755, partial [Candidatus Binataceae bacterium]
MDFGVALTAVALIGMFGALIFLRRSERPAVTRQVIRRMSRPERVAQDGIIKQGRRRAKSSEFFEWLYNLDLLQR